MERRFAKQARRWSKGAGWLFCDWQTNKGSRLGEACYSHRLGGGGSRRPNLRLRSSAAFLMAYIFSPEDDKRNAGDFLMADE